MSLFSYISFPRVPDLSILEKDLEASKVKTIGQARGTATEQKLGADLSAFPKEMDNTPLIMGDIFKYAKGLTICENKLATFTGVFNNKHIYEFSGTLEQMDEEAKLKGFAALGLSADAFPYKIVKHEIENCKICRSQLLQLVNENLFSGESIEIFSEYVSGLITNLGPFERKTTIGSDEILKTDCFNYNWDKVKFVIIKR